MKKHNTVVIIFLLSVLPLLSGCLKSEDNIDEDNGGEDFVFTMLDGSEKHLKDYRGKVVILDMWATWCTPCQYQMLELKKAYEGYSRGDLEIISLDIDLSETPQQVQSFRESFEEYGYELNWVFGMDDGSVWGTYKMERGGIPTLCIFNQEGNLYFSHEGVIVFSEIPSGWPEDTPKLAPKIDALLESNRI